MDGGSASILLDRPSPSTPSSPLPLTEQIRVLFSYAEDRTARVSFLKSILRKQQEAFIPPEIPRDLILEAKIRIGDEKKASASRVASILSLECSPSDEDQRQQILQVESSIGRMLSDDELSAVLDSPNTRVGDGIQADGFHQSHLLDGNVGVSVKTAPGPSIAACAATSRPNQTTPTVPGLKGSDVMKTSNLKGGAAPPSKTAAWSSLFSHQVGHARDLTLHTKPSTDPDHHVEFDEADSMEALQNWGNSLVGYFIGKSTIWICLI